MGTSEPAKGSSGLNQTVALEVRGHLAKRRLKRRDLAHALNVSVRTVSDLLGERRPWRIDEVETVAAWLDISPAELMFPSNPRRRH
ncbi:hypothetical protein Srot_0789 [Segniliparus rotundus DSM 44985]|uniref:HTH cro/C1-type domain-containing protein n=1 Tax=Segniliparus rotundus (strain ATCC BAA-972 / CDC 1076 / CIP 108378 / DSM 44985 / JCM 13578) TaxID=640132 RepID=D6ZDY8_SEGRD|nr:helix-turn-helix transcriptional regulator [Segniliparus rotundus]ADG97268.1 hypothetical protein Srot_0789 [Segniliparus rotundus DSM 44985]